MIKARHHFAGQQPSLVSDKAEQQRVYFASEEANRRKWMGLDERSEKPERPIRKH
ncbi:hypothetical protein [Sphingobium bisphenolivorans]|uniref:hypothetical protein n=1 Tax=Sphingobium bisphenolivorans TaxID=1335760 RepID=UPI0003A31621|nr:hypothetical protein [Sphingobium bisphenolivorans]